MDDFDFELFFGKDKSNNRVIVDRILDGTYKLCESSVNICDNVITLYLVHDKPVDKSIILDENKIMGIDLGINRPVSIHIHGEKYQPQQIEIGSKIQHDRIRMKKTRDSLYKSLKHTNGGHGRKKKLAALEKLKSNESKWATNINHNISKTVVDICLKYMVGTINMEDLTGITTNVSDYFLKSWKFYELQTFIKYKAEAVGIKINWVNPMYTSLTCPVCGTHSKENRDDKDKTKFKCTNIVCESYGIEKDADINAAVNISKINGTEVKLKSKKGRLSKKKLTNE